MAGSVATMAHTFCVDLLKFAQSGRALFSIIADKAIRRGSFKSVKEMTTKIDTFINLYNQTCNPFIWTATADSIPQKLARLCGRLCGMGH